jgi:hypothetical protein
MQMLLAAGAALVREAARLCFVFHNIPDGGDVDKTFRR